MSKANLCPLLLIWMYIDQQVQVQEQEQEQIVQKAKEVPM
jgi:hypothetical protein